MNRSELDHGGHVQSTDARKLQRGAANIKAEHGTAIAALLNHLVGEGAEEDRLDVTEQGLLAEPMGEFVPNPWRRKKDRKRGAFV